ncbi:hypothetical protein JYT83_00385 [bacterium AH-315-F18]|nr:hypothetical protein [bacterium AH-315-F18]
MNWSDPEDRLSIFYRVYQASGIGTLLSIPFFYYEYGLRVAVVLALHVLGVLVFSAWRGDTTQKALSLRWVTAIAGIVWIVVPLWVGGTLRLQAELAVFGVLFIGYAVSASVPTTKRWRVAGRTFLTYLFDLAQIGILVAGLVILAVAVSRGLVDGIAVGILVSGAGAWICYAWYFGGHRKKITDETREIRNLPAQIT